MFVVVMVAASSFRCPCRGEPCVRPLTASHSFRSRDTNGDLWEGEDKLSPYSKPVGRRRGASIGLDSFDGNEVFDFEHHAARAIVGGEDVGRPDLAETEGRHGCLLVFGIADRTFDQRHLDIR